jgi:peptide/nickel transport system substrate-binding protein
MKKVLKQSTLASLLLSAFVFEVALSPTSLAQEWAFQVRPKGTLKVVALEFPSASAAHNYAEHLVSTDKDNNYVPGLAEDWRWIDDKTIEFRLRRGVTFHNGEEFNADAVRTNWEAYKRMETPRVISFTRLPDETLFQKLDSYTVRFTFPEPDGLALVKFWWFFQIAPAFFEEHKFEERQWGYLPEAGPWGTGPFKMVEGCSFLGRPSESIVLEAYEGYWDRRYPKLKRVILNNKLCGDREEAMRLCRETDGGVDIVSDIRSLDTLKVEESPFAKVVKSRDVSILWGWFNERKRGSKWQDARLRKAVNYAINREELWKYAAKGNAYNLGGLYPPPGAYGHDADLAPWAYDTAKARVLLAEAGYPEGFELKIITTEAWRLESQIICKMLARIGLRTKVDVFRHSKWFSKVYVPILDKPPEEQDWDISIYRMRDFYGHIGASMMPYPLIEECNIRWIEYDQAYEEKWRAMAKTLDSVAQQEQIRRMAHYIREQAYFLSVYSPLTLYAVNKNVDFVPYKFGWMQFKETSVTENHWSIRGK